MCRKHIKGNKIFTSARSYLRVKQYRYGTDREGRIFSFLTVGYVNILSHLSVNDSPETGERVIDERGEPEASFLKLPVTNAR